MSKINKKSVTAILIISLCAFFLVSPQIYKHALIVSNDWVFHMNRFYDTAMQLKNGTFNYFQSIYGFSQSGRVINALYGTDFAYLHGLLLLIFKTWFRFQLVSTFLCYFTAGTSMYFLGRYCHLEQKIATGMAILYMGTPTIFYYTLAQNFSGWGAAFLPLIFIPAVRMIRNRKSPIQPVVLGGTISLLLSVHMFSTLLAVAALIPFFLVGLLYSNKKLVIIKQALLAVVIAIGLSFNTFAAFLDLSNDTLIPPYAVTNLLSNSTSLSFGSIGWTNFGLILSMIFIFQLVFTIVHFNKLNVLEKTINLVGAFFLLVSSKYIPWNDIGNYFTFVRKMQFPQRLGCLACILLILGFGFTIQKTFVTLEKQSVLKISVPLLLTFSLLNLTGGYALISDTAAIWNSDAPLSKDTSAAETLESNASNIRHLFGGNADLSAALQIHRKPMADYLPASGGQLEDPYKAYKEDVLHNSIPLKRSIDKQGNIHLTFTAKDTNKITLPVIIYHNSSLIINGKSRSEAQYSLTSIGALRISPKIGTNEIIVGYKPGKLFRSAIYLRILTVVIIIAYYMSKRCKFFSKNKRTQ